MKHEAINELFWIYKEGITLFVQLSKNMFICKRKHEPLKVKCILLDHVYTGCSALCDFTDLVPALLGSERPPQKIYLELVISAPCDGQYSVSALHIVHMHIHNDPA